MKKTLILSIAAAVMALPALAALTSGLKPGSQVTPFHPTHVSGPLAGSDKCFPCTYQNRPQIQVWVNGDDMANVTAIAKSLDRAMSRYTGQEFKAMIVVLSNPSNDAMLRTSAAKFAKDGQLSRIAVAVLPSTHEAVKAYQINTSADIKNTVIAYEGWKVVANMVNLKGNEKGIASLDTAIAELVK